MLLLLSAVTRLICSDLKRTYRFIDTKHYFSLVNTVFIIPESVLQFCLFTKFFLTPKSILIVLLQSFTDMSKAAKNVSHHMSTLPAEIEQGDDLTSCFSSHTEMIRA